MDGLLRLNDYNIIKNPAAGAHDPSMMWDPLSGKYYSYCTDVDGQPLGLPCKIGIPVRSSKDLLHFKYEGTALSVQAVAQAADNGPFPATKSFWAPFVEYVHGEYRMYYSATKAFGSSQSRIWLAVAQNPLGPFENRGIVADTWGTDDTFPNAIDPHIVWDGSENYLVYGSFFGGIFIKPLDPDTGLTRDGHPKTLGICISRKSQDPVIDGPEGAAVIYVPETGYYYLFQSYGWLGENYDIRVARSKCVAGPYVDFWNKSTVGQSMGIKIAGSYRFDAKMPPAGADESGWSWGGFFAPGHGVPFFDPMREKYFFVHHIRDGAQVNRTYNKSDRRASYKRHYMMIRPMFFVDGWPVFGPEAYSGSDFEPVPAGDYAGTWEIIRFDDVDNGQKCSCQMKLSQFSDGHARLLRCYDFENQKDTIAVTGIDDSGIAYWGKLLYHYV